MLADWGDLDLLDLEFPTFHPQFQTYSAILTLHGCNPAMEFACSNADCILMDRRFVLVVEDSTYILVTVC